MTQNANTVHATPTATKAPAAKVQPAPKASTTPATPKVKAEKTGPSPVFSIPATKEDKTFISLQSARTGVSQKELLKQAITASRKAIEALPKYVEPAPVLKVKAKKAQDAEKALTPASV